MKEEQKQLSDRQAQAIWDKALKAAIDSAGVRVNRESYLNDVLKQQQLSRPLEVTGEVINDVLQGLMRVSNIPNCLIEPIFNEEKCIIVDTLKNLRTNTIQELLSKVLPTTLIAIQRLLYLYGMKEIWYCQDREDDSKYLLVMTLGVMFNISNIKINYGAIPIITSVNMRDEFFQDGNDSLCQLALCNTRKISKSYVNEMRRYVRDGNVASNINKRLDELRTHIDTKRVIN